MPLLRITFAALLATLGVSCEMVLLFWVVLGVTVAKGTWSATASSAFGEGVLMRDTEKRPCTLGVWTSGVLTAGDFPFAGVGDFVAGDAALAEGVLGFGDLFAALGEGVLGFGDFLAGDAALGEGDLDFGDFFPGVGVLGEAFLALVFLGDGVLILAGLCTFSWSNSYKKDQF